MGIKKRHWTMLLVITISIAIGGVLGVFVSKKNWLQGYFFPSDSKLETIIEIINEEYVDSISIQDLVEKSIPHIVNELDPHSSYIPKNNAQTLIEEMNGSFGGIGVEVDLFPYLDTLVITKIIQGGPCDQAGLLTGDRIVRINQTDYLGKDSNIEEIIDPMHGEVGSTIKLEIVRPPEEELLTYTLKRDTIPTQTVVAAYQLEDEIGLIKIYDKFSHKTHDEFIKALAKLKAKGCTSYILDLRGNGGGAMNSAINIANEFLPAGCPIVFTEGKSIPTNEIYANGTGSFQDGQLVVLIDQLSASASEILAGAIQDNDRGLIIGRRSYGKGLVQNHIQLADSSVLRLTIARYFTPSGRNIQRPYELGGSKQYNQEWFDLLLSDESFHEDKVKLDTTTLYKTSHGRTVYGGGGIMPDLFIPMDTTSLTSYYLNLEKKNIFSQFAFYYADHNRDTLKKIKAYPDMLLHLEKDSILPEIVRFAEKQGIKRRSYLITKSSRQILTMAYAYVLRFYFGDEAFFPIYMRDDKTIQTAVKAIKENYANPKSIYKEEYKKLKEK